MNLLLTYLLTYIYEPRSIHPFKFSHQTDCAKNSEVVGYTIQQNLRDPSLSHFVTIHSRYKQTTDIQIDDVLWQQPDFAIKLQRSAKNS